MEKCPDCIDGLVEDTGCAIGNDYMAGPCDTCNGTGNKFGAKK